MTERGNVGVESSGRRMTEGVGSSRALGDKGLQGEYSSAITRSHMRASARFRA